MGIDNFSNSSIPEPNADDRKRIDDILLQSINHDVNWPTLIATLRRLSTVGVAELARNVFARDDPLGRSLLINLLARNPPLEAITEFLRVFPESLAQNLSALFTACQYAEKDIIRVLIRFAMGEATENNSSTGLPSNDVECPYPWITVHYVNPKATRALLEEYPEGVLQSSQSFGVANYCPLDVMIYARGETKTDASFWGKLLLMLMVSEHGKIALDRPFHPVHAFLKRVVASPVFFQDINAARSVLTLLHKWRMMKPAHFQIQDQKGDFPVHLVLRNKCLSQVFADAGYSASMMASQDLVTVLVETHPESVKVVFKNSKEGRRLPLHAALENGWPCRDILLKAAPDTLMQRDSKTNLYAFQVAAACAPAPCPHSPKFSLYSLENIYELLREAPSSIGLVDPGSSPGTTASSRPVDKLNDVPKKLQVPNQVSGSRIQGRFKRKSSSCALDSSVYALPLEDPSRMTINATGPSTR